MAVSLFRPFLVAALAISPLAQALRFTYPTPAENAYAANISYALGDTVNFAWDSVDSDPANFSLYLWEFVNYPPTYELVAYDVETKAGKASFQIPCDIKPSANWQLTMTEGINVYVVYAQTARFNIKSSKGVCDVPEPDPEKSSGSSTYDDE